MIRPGQTDRQRETVRETDRWSICALLSKTRELGSLVLLPKGEKYFRAPLQESSEDREVEL